MPVNESEQEHHEGGSSPGASVRRRYEAPRILHREALEAMAAVCAPRPPAKGNVGVCSQGPISS
jgi:hypothetical protein